MENLVSQQQRVRVLGHSHPVYQAVQSKEYKSGY